MTPWSIACQAPLSLEFSRQKYWSGLPCPSPVSVSTKTQGFPGGPVVESLPSNAGNTGLIPHQGIRWRRKWRPTPVFLPGESQGRGSLVACRQWGRTESDTTERLHFNFPLSCIGEGNGSPLQCSCLENPRDGGAWWAAISGVAQSQTQTYKKIDQICGYHWWGMERELDDGSQKGQTSN